ncbi:MAG: cell division ATPase MinD [Candidatus Aenigmarchaeota archaeon]|nr:cell division ATPase MinD [Candidatus Aenigmarchaeota archaeon]
MARIISIVSGKGGVGKTVTTANLGVALAELGHPVTVVDCNLTTPNLGMHLGVPVLPKTLHDVLKGRARLSDVMYQHEFGLKVIPAGLSVNDLKGIDARDLPNILSELFVTDDLVLIDGAAGLGREALATLQSSDEMLIVTNPELPAVLDALKLEKLAEELGAKLYGVVLNRVSGKPHELTDREVEETLELPIIGKIPEDPNVKKAVAKRIPVVKYNSYAPASIAFKRLAAELIGARIEVDIPWWRKVFSFLR